MKGGDQFIRWSTEVDFDDLGTEYTMSLRAMEHFEFLKCGPHPCF